MKPKNLYDRLVLERNEIRAEIACKNENIKILQAEVRLLEDRKYKLESILEDFGKHVLEHYEENENEVDS